MPISHENYEFKFLKSGKKWVYVPNELGRKIGEQLHNKILRAFKFDPFVYHFKDGSHVMALHRHRANKFFCRIDLERFFYSVTRNRVKRALKDLGIPKPEYYAKWSTVRNPYPGGGYVVPYGFIQSPLISTLILSNSPIGAYLRGLDKSVTASVYMDDICLSGADENQLTEALEGLIKAVEEAGFKINEGKTRYPANTIDIFNCLLEGGSTEVLQERIDEFYSVPRSDQSIEGFEIYCNIVASHTWRVGAGKKRRRAAYLARRKASRRPKPII